MPSLNQGGARQRGYAAMLIMLFNIVRLRHDYTGYITHSAVAVLQFRSRFSLLRHCSVGVLSSLLLQTTHCHGVGLVLARVCSLFRSRRARRYPRAIGKTFFRQKKTWWCTCSTGRAAMRTAQTHSQITIRVFPKTLPTAGDFINKTNTRRIMNKQMF